MKYFQNLHLNSRFYILAAAVLVSLLAACALRLMIAEDRLFGIRVQEVFGLLSVVLVYIAILLTPLSKLFDKTRPWLSRLLFARRAIGVSAAYFALLHTLIALFGQLGGPGGLALLPGLFLSAVVMGIVALVILLLMAATSFDAVIKVMTFRRWKWLHRFVYLAGGLIIVHIWLIGSHARQPWIAWAAFAAIAVLLALESLRLGREVAAKWQLPQSEAWSTATALFIVMVLALLALPSLAESHGGGHHTSYRLEAVS